MSTVQLDSEVGVDRNAETPTALEIVVGFDGTDSSVRALHAAQRILADRVGHIHVVWIAHVPASAGVSAEATVRIEEGFDAVAAELSALATSILGPAEGRWTMERRDGGISHELFLAAEAAEKAAPDARVVIVVGAPDHAYHRVGGSVPGHLAHQNRFALTVIPSDKH